ncbi:hypothetical protein K7432_014559 [Basidiobolus ranarum]|uniref:Yeast cell wall synthesis Kre9/Knh1-like N-terminal domain-containing protein n=1 Tax=Basidiobolus ranarum TaxID=34480 RepID=A0ABR2VPC7_9FUNG
MKFISLSTSALLVLAMVARYVDAGVAITGPLGNTWAAGSSHIITWTDNGDGTPMPATINIDLMTGPMTALQLVGNVATNVDSVTGQYTWSVPATITPGKEYALRFGTPPNVAYSPYFEISAAGSEGGAGSAPVGGVAGTSAPASASPSASGSASTGASSSATPSAASASSNGSHRPTSTGAQSMASNKPTTVIPVGAKQSGSNILEVIPSIGMALVFSLITQIIN